MDVDRVAFLNIAFYHGQNHKLNLVMVFVTADVDAESNADTTTTFKRSGSW